MRVIQKLIAAYFLAGAITAFIAYTGMQPEWNFILYLIPNLVATIVFCLYAVGSLLYLKNFGENNYKTLFLVIILLQSLHFEFNGFCFSNVYMPELCCRINLKSLSDSGFKFTPFTFRVMNGYFRDNNNLLLSVNLFGIAVLVFSSLKPGFSTKPA